MPSRILSNARSRPESFTGFPVVSSRSGGLNLRTVAGNRVPLENRTVICGWGVNCNPLIARSIISRRSRSSRSGRWPRATFCAWSAGSTHAWSIAVVFSSWVTHGGRRWAGSTTCAFVTTQPLPSTSQPVPVSMNGRGFTVTGPWPQLTVTSASTRAVMSTTAGLARRMASCADKANEDAGAASAASVTAAPASRRFMVPPPYHGAPPMDRTGRSVSPARGVVEAALLVGEELTRPEMCEQMDQSQSGVRAFDVGHRCAHRRFVRGGGREEGAQAPLRREQTSGRRLRFGEHRVHHPLHRALLVGMEPQPVLELEDVQRAWIAFLVGDEGQPETPTIGDHGLELLLALLCCEMRLVALPAVVSVLRSRHGRRGDNDPDRHPRPHAAASSRSGGASVARTTRLRP